MFTGIIEALGKIQHIEKQPDGHILYINTGKLALDDVVIGDSIAVNGVCLTAIKLENDGFIADVSQETLTTTTLKDIKVNEAVNLEKALTPTSRLGGHMVSGHVDGIAKVLVVKDMGKYILLTIELPTLLAKYIAKKGSVCIDGISLTVNRVDNNNFDLMIVPHTKHNTIIQNYRTNTLVNLEVDVVARYIERLLTNQSISGISKELLNQYGFIK